jgi:hypothetical protein
MAVSRFMTPELTFSNSPVCVHVPTFQGLLLVPMVMTADRRPESS